MASPEQSNAFAAFDFEGDLRWRQYRSNLEIPAGRNMEQVLLRYKQKFYRANVDPTFVLSASSGPSSASQTAPPKTSAPRNTSARTPPAAPSSSSSAAGPSASASASASRSRLGSLPFNLDTPTLLFLANAWVTVMALLALFPLLPAVVSRRAYRLTLWGTLGSSMAGVVRQAGLPRGWRLPALRSWLATSLTTPPFLAALYTTVFLTSPATLAMAVTPLAIPAALHTAAHLRTHFAQAHLYRRYLSRPCAWLEAHAGQARMLQANAEVGVGFSLVFQLITPQRNFLQLFVYWNLLKIMYHAPPTAATHRALWAAIQQRTQPLLALVPAINTPLRYVQNWFQQV